MVDILKKGINSRRLPLKVVVGTLEVPKKNN